MIRNTSRKMQWSGLGAVILNVGLVVCGNAAENSGTKTVPHPNTHTSTTVATARPVNVKTGTASTPSAGAFKEAAAIWKQVKAANAALDKVIKSKKLKTVHEAAFKVRDIVKTLPAKSKSLPADKQKTLASQVKNVAGLAKLLDEAGDSNNLKSTQENQAGLNDALDIIKGLYPSGALGS